MLETSNCVNCSRRNTKRSAKYVYHNGTLASSIARAGTSCVKEEEKIRNSSTRWTFFQFPSTSSRKDDLTDIVMVRSRETGNILRLTSFPSIVRRMRNLCELTLKIFFDSPEMNRSILFSMYFLRMAKKMHYFL